MLENTESQEMYLTTIYALQKKNGMVRSVDVADERGYSKVSVHNAMERLEEFGYVTFHQGKITLTKCGIEKVKNIEQKHQTIASALKLIGASNDIAEENACRMEHVINVSGKISDERFAKMTATYEAEQDGLQQTAQRLKDEISAVREEGESVDRFMKLVNKYSDITELNAEIIRTFVEKIIVYEAEKIDGVKMQRVKIVYNCVGAVSVANADNEPVKTDKTKIIEVA